MAISIFIEIYIMFIEMAPYLLLGLFFAGLLHVLVDAKTILKHLGSNSILSVVKAALFGVPLPLCSCGVVSTALSLRKSQASEGATVSFLISTPQTGIDSIVATYGMMGPIMAVFRPLAAFVTGIIGGIATNIFVSNNKQIVNSSTDNSKDECRICNSDLPHSHSIIEKTKKMFFYAFVEFLDDISVQLSIGIIIAGIISFIIPDGFFLEYGGSGPLGVLLMNFIAIPFYICATGSIPIAVALIIKGISPGAAFVFLMAGPATNAATITLLSATLGKKITAIYIGTISIGAIVAGLLFNLFLDVSGIDIAKQINMEMHDMSSDGAKELFSILFLILIVASLYRKIKPKIMWRKNEMKGKMIIIEGMTCSKCVEHVTRAIESLNGVTSVKVDLNTKFADIEGDYNKNDVEEAIETAGYKVGRQDSDLIK